MIKSNKSLRGDDLTKLIEHELLLMSAEGYETSPITPKNVHTRIKEKAVIRSGLSILSTPERKEMIKSYRDAQIAQDPKMSAESKVDAINNRTSASQRKIIASKNCEIRDLKEKFEMNCATLVKIIQAVELSDSKVDIEAILSEFLMKNSWDSKKFLLK